MLTASIRKMSSVAYKLDNPSPVVQRAVEQVVRAKAIKLEALVKDKLSNRVLNVKSGRLRRSIQHRVIANGNVILGQVFSSGDVKYARIHEMGGQTRPHDIFPKGAKALAFKMGGKQVFARSVRHPGSKIPERSYMRSSLGDMQLEIVRDIRLAVIRSLKA